MNKPQTSIFGSVYFVLMAIFLYLPIVILIVFSFNDSTVLVFPLKGFTLEWYRQLGNARELLISARNSVWVGVLSSILAVLLGSLAAIAMTKRHMPGRNIFLSLASVPLVMPSIVLSVAMLVFFRKVLGLELNMWLIAAAQSIIHNESRIAYALCRPPGHHAGRDMIGGYCYLNNAAIAANQLQQALGRGAILDIDYHHGNGTQEIFWDDPEVLFVSIHVDPADEYPFFSG